MKVRRDRSYPSPILSGPLAHNTYYATSVNHCLVDKIPASIRPLMTVNVMTASILMGRDAVIRVVYQYFPSSFLSSIFATAIFFFFLHETESGKGIQQGKPLTFLLLSSLLSNREQLAQSAAHLVPKQWHLVLRELRESQGLSLTLPKHQIHPTLLTGLRFCRQP